MPEYLTCTECGNRTPSYRLARIDTEVAGAYVIVCEWCESGEPRPSQEAIMEEAAQRDREMVAEYEAENEGENEPPASDD